MFSTLFATANAIVPTPQPDAVLLLQLLWIISPAPLVTTFATAKLGAVFEPRNGPLATS